MKDAEIDWRDPQSIVSAIVANGCRASPLMLERLLEHCGFEEVGSLPTRNTWTAVTWAHRARERYPDLRRFLIVIQHPTELGAPSVIPILQALAEANRVASTCGAGAPVLTF